MYHPDGLHEVLRFFDLIEVAGIPDLNTMSHNAKTEKVLNLLREKFEELSAPAYPLRVSLQKLNTLEPIRIIEGKA